MFGQLLVLQRNGGKISQIALAYHTDNSSEIEYEREFRQSNILIGFYDVITNTSGAANPYTKGLIKLQLCSSTQAERVRIPEAYKMTP